jgi:hypothetical protein
VLVPDTAAGAVRAVAAGATPLRPAALPASNDPDRRWGKTGREGSPVLPWVACRALGAATAAAGALLRCPLAEGRLWPALARAAAWVGLLVPLGAAAEPAPEVRCVEPAGDASGEPFLATSGAATGGRDGTGTPAMVLRINSRLFNRRCRCPVTQKPPQATVTYTPETPPTTQPPGAFPRRCFRPHGPPHLVAGYPCGSDPCLPAGTGRPCLLSLTPRIAQLG